MGSCVLFLTAVLPIAPAGLVSGDAPPGAEALLVRLLQGAPDLSTTGTVKIHGPDGVVERVIDGHEFVRVLAEIAGRAPSEGVPQDLVHDARRVGWGHPYGSQYTGWPYCDVASMWVYWYGPSSPVKHAVVHSLDGLWPKEEVCGGSYGRAHRWLDVTFDARRVGTTLCAGAQLMFPYADNPHGFFGGISCGWRVGCGAGVGVLYVYHWWLFGFAYFLGGGESTLLVGHDSIDVHFCGAL